MRLGDLPAGSKFKTLLTHRVGEVRNQTQFGSVEVVWLDFDGTPLGTKLVHVDCQVAEVQP